MNKEEINITQVTNKDTSFFKKTIYVDPEKAKPPKKILDSPELSKYINDWDKKRDYGLIVNINKKQVGAAWTRKFSKYNAGYGFVNEEIPELAMALKKEHRNKGLGTMLLTRLIDDIKKNNFTKKLSLSVSPQNPASRLYKRLGFNEFGQKGDSKILVLDLNKFK